MFIFFFFLFFFFSSRRRHTRSKRDWSSDVCSSGSLPSQLESFGLAALEAMACEVPVIGTNAGGMREVVEHGVDGYLVEPGDVQSAARYAIEILSRADRGREMGKKARVNAKKKFCANEVIPMYEAYYKRILSES